jgi:hypothetical protein
VLWREYHERLYDITLSKQILLEHVESNKMNVYDFIFLAQVPSPTSYRTKGIVQHLSIDSLYFVTFSISMFTHVYLNEQCPEHA